MELALLIGRRHFAAVMEGRRHEQNAPEFKAVRRGWCMGDKAFRKELLAQVQERRGPHHYGEECLEADQSRAERIPGRTTKPVGLDGGTVANPEQMR